jgi:transposase
VLVKIQQVAQLVERPIEVVEYHQLRCRCHSCGQESSGAWPTRVIPGQDFDASLQALLGWLGCYGQISYEKQAELLHELGQIEVGVGTLVKTNERIATTITNAVNELVEALPQQSYLYVDETPWLVKGVKEWLWVATNPNFCLFHGADTRGRVELETLLGKHFDFGVLVSDDFKVYNGYPVAAQQKCLAHLRRHIQKLIKFGTQVQVTIGETFLDLVDEAFRQHREWRENGDDSSYRTWGVEFRSRVEVALTEWLPKAGYEAGKLLRNLKEKAEQWWYFLEHPEVPPDNNLAERALRLAVTKRKVSGGSRSMARFEKTAKLLSVVQTCRFQGRSFMQFLQEALSAYAHPELPYPTLIPPVPT